MNKLLFLSIAILLLQYDILAQAPITLWTKYYGSGSGNSVQQTGDGGYIIAGSSGALIYLAKTDSLGDTIWTKTYGYGNGYSVQQTDDGGYIIAGRSGDFFYRFCLIKTDKSGDTLWTKTYGGSAPFEQGNSVQQTSDGGYIVTGSMGNDICLIKTDKSGDTLWTKTFGGNINNIDEGYSVQQTNDGGYVITGSLGGDVCLIKTDSSGDTVWTKTYAGNRGRSVQQTLDGGYIVTGRGGNGGYLIKTDSFGDTLWTKTFGTYNSMSEGNSVQQTSDSGYVVTGSMFYDLCLIKLAPEYVHIHDVMTDNTYYLTGQDTVHISAIIENLNSHQLAAKAYIYNLNDVLNDSTNLTNQVTIKDSEKWTGEVIAPQMEDFFKISVDVIDQTISHHFILNNTARFTTAGPLTIDSIEYTVLSNFRYGIKPIIKNEGTSLPISNIQIKLYCNDPWVTEIYPSIHKWHYILPGASKLLPLPFSITYNSAIFPGYFNLEFEMLSDGWLYWRDSSFTTIVTGIEEELSLPSVFSLEQNYPNPFNPATTIKYEIPGQACLPARHVRNDNSLVTLKIYDVLGCEVATLVNQIQKPGNYEVTWDASNFSSGVYYYQLRTGTYTSVKKMILLK